MDTKTMKVNLFNNQLILIKLQTIFTNSLLNKTNSIINKVLIISNLLWPIPVLFLLKEWWIRIWWGLR